MTAVVSAFARAYHSENNQIKIFDDYLAKSLLSDPLYEGVAQNMGQGIGFFNPDFEGDSDEALRWIVNDQLAPSPVGRAAFTEDHLNRVSSQHERLQYVILAAGYDTYAYRQDAQKVTGGIFELDLPEMIEDKKAKVRQAQMKVPDNLYQVPVDLSEPTWIDALCHHPAFDVTAPTFFSLLGIAYYLKESDFKGIIKAISSKMKGNVYLAFDYSDPLTLTDQAGERTRKQLMMAAQSGESMLSGYSKEDMKTMCQEVGLCIETNLEPAEITQLYFKTYNEANPDWPMTAFDNVNYCLAKRCRSH